MQENMEMIIEEKETIITEPKQQAAIIDYNEMVRNALKNAYSKEIEWIKKRWKEVYHLDQAKGMTEEEYIKIMLPKMINKKKGDFQSFDQKNRMSEIVNPFGIRANPDLFKKHYSTGFPELDEVLSGGFTPGVHVIGAVSSLGKSTFLLQMADNMASQKIPVIYVSLEMSSRDLAAKLISKHSLLLTFEHPEKAKSMGDLTLEPVLTHLRDDEWEIMKEAVAITKEHGKYLTVFERKAEGITINSIEQYVKNYIETYMIKPVVIIDYLQILSPTEDMKRCTDKQCVDRNISEIRSLSMTYDVAVIAISSFNREYYNQPASLQAFKESGNIEYSSDTLIGLQLFGVGRKSMDIEEEKKKYPRTIEAIILKNRTGPSGKVIEYNFYPVHNYFKELQGNPFAAAEEEEEKRMKEEKRKEAEQRRREKNKKKEQAESEIKNAETMKQMQLPGVTMATEAKKTKKKAVRSY